jgi:hypothetical protein
MQKEDKSKKQKGTSQERQELCKHDNRGYDIVDWTLNSTVANMELEEYFFLFCG